MLAKLGECAVLFHGSFFCCNEGSCGMTMNEVKIGAITSLSY